MSTSKPYSFYISPNSCNALDAIEEIQNQLGEVGGSLAVVSYFPLPYGPASIADIEDHIPQLRHQAEHFAESSTGGEFWFAQVMPFDKGGRIKYLTLNTYSEITVAENHSDEMYRYIGTMEVEED